jgi:hypothetical protein
MSDLGAIREQLGREILPLGLALRETAAEVLPIRMQEPSG